MAYPFEAPNVSLGSESSIVVTFPAESPDVGCKDTRMGNTLGLAVLKLNMVLSLV
jgi:hypothetical protein